MGLEGRVRWRWVGDGRTRCHRKRLCLQQLLRDRSCRLDLLVRLVYLLLSPMPSRLPRLQPGNHALEHRAGRRLALHRSLLRSSRGSTSSSSSSSSSNSTNTAWRIIHKLNTALLSNRSALRPVLSRLC